MNEEDHELLKEILAGIKEVSQKLDRLMGHFGVGSGYTITISPDPAPPPFGDWENGDALRYPYEFPATTGGQP